jgi:hypothetical protein
MDSQEQLKLLQREVMDKAAAHLAAVNKLPDAGEPPAELLAEAHRTNLEWKEAMARFNDLLAQLMGEDK